MYLGDAGRSSVDSYYEIAMQGRTYAEGAARMVWVDLASGRPVPLPETVAGTPRAPAEMPAPANRRPSGVDTKARST
jgi:acyl-CoA thioester hydrolase